MIKFWWSELAVAGTCVDLLTERGIEGNELKEGRIEAGNFFGVKIVNAGTCDVKIVITGNCDGKGNILGKSDVAT